MLGVDDLGMELDRVEPPRLVADGRVGQFALVADTRKPAGISETRSPWLIQTMKRSGSPANSGLSGSVRSSVFPYSRLSPGTTWPPSVRDISCMP